MGENFHGITPYNGVGIIKEETFSIGLKMFLLKIGVSQTCFEIALTWPSSKVGLWIHKGSIRDDL